MLGWTQFNSHKKTIIVIIIIIIILDKFVVNLVFDLDGEFTYGAFARVQ